MKTCLICDISIEKAVNQILKTTTLFHLRMPVACKCMEHIIVSQIMKHLKKNNILTDSQFGFRAHHSCESQLFVTINDIAKAMDEYYKLMHGPVQDYIWIYVHTMRIKCKTVATHSTFHIELSSYIE